jgi:hypothetical protein
VTIFGHDHPDAAGCLTFRKFRKRLTGRENQIARFGVLGSWPSLRARVPAPAGCPQSSHLKFHRRE